MKSLINKNTPPRNYGVDLLKILSMMMVLGLHLNKYGGFLDADMSYWEKFAVNYYEHLCIVAVNVFVIISAWFLRERTASINKTLSLVSAIVFWTIVSLLVVHLLGQNVTVKWVVKSIPFFGRAYDFLSGYLVMYMLSPVLNNMLNSSTRKQIALLAFGAFFVFSLMTPITSSAYLKINGGYSCFWFICLYLMTAYLKEYHRKLNRSERFSLLSLYFIMGAIAVFFTLHKLPILGSLAYNNVMVTIAAFSIFLFFKDIKINNVYANRIIKFLAPMTLGVFLIHDHNLMEQYYLTLNLSSMFTGKMHLYIIGFPVILIIIYLICSVLEYIRIKMFDLVKIPDVLNKLALRIDGTLCKIK